MNDKPGKEKGSKTFYLPPDIAKCVVLWEVYILTAQY